ncbi:MAG: ABC transporter ATP-binding protein [Desulfovermiculus sp.]|nr:ABC transporter ATP-binding protein [Desulfovermiculus sp.]
MLELDDVHTYYGLSHILFGVSLQVAQGEVVCLLGRNGAGKSTTMKSIIGLAPPKRGTIRFQGKVISGLKPHVIARQGIGFVPDDRRVFADLSVRENLEISERKALGYNFWDQKKIFDFFPALQEIASRKASYLSGGEQQMLTIARALLTNPKLLLLDEPMEGLAPQVVKTLEQQIQTLGDQGMTVLLTEQNCQIALSLSQRIYIIDNGMIRYQGTVDELQADDEVKRKYLLL